MAALGIIVTKVTQIKSRSKKLVDDLEVLAETKSRTYTETTWEILVHYDFIELMEYVICHLIDNVSAD